MGNDNAEVAPGLRSDVRDHLRFAALGPRGHPKRTGPLIKLVRNPGAVNNWCE